MPSWVHCHGKLSWVKALLWLGGWLCFQSPIVLAQNTITTIPYADPAPTIDGDGSDWPGDDIIIHTMLHPSRPHANRMEVQLLWDEQYLYLYAFIRDNPLIMLTEDSTRLYLNDAVEVYIDPLDDSGKRMDINDYQYIVDWKGASAVLKGDKTAILDSSKTAPKEFGISTVAFQHAAVSMPAGEAGYSVEMALPFAGMGALPKAGMGLKIDFCVDDVDSFIDLPSWPEEQPLPLYFASNWDGYTDFSFPDHWRRFSLVGGPSIGSRIGRQLALYWQYLAIILTVAGIVIIWQARRIAQLKDVLPKASFDQHMIQDLVNAQPIQAATATPPVPIVLEAEPAPIADAAAVSAPAPLGIQHPLVERCRQFVLRRLDEELKMEELASECAVSLRQLQRIFKEQMNMSPGNFVVIIKMEHAATLLRSGNYNVSEVAWQLGFSDSSYFSRVFKKYHGIPPKQLKMEN